MQRFTELKVWQRAHAIVLDIYHLTGTFPPDERCGLVSRLRRAAASMPTNIAEGSKRQSRAEYARFLNVAEGSLAETEYPLMLGRDLGFADDDEANRYLQELSQIARMLNSLRSRVETAQK